MALWMKAAERPCRTTCPDGDMIGDKNAPVRENMKILNRPVCR